MFAKSLNGIFVLVKLLFYTLYLDYITYEYNNVHTIHVHLKFLANLFENN